MAPHTRRQSNVKPRRLVAAQSRRHAYRRTADADAVVKTPPYSRCVAVLSLPA